MIRDDSGIRQTPRYHGFDSIQFCGVSNLDATAKSKLGLQAHQLAAPESHHRLSDSNRFLKQSMWVSPKMLIPRCDAVRMPLISRISEIPPPPGQTSPAPAAPAAPLGPRRPRGAPALCRGLLPATGGETCDLCAKNQKGFGNHGIRRNE